MLGAVIGTLLEVPPEGLPLVGAPVLGAVVGTLLEGSLVGILVLGVVVGTLLEVSPPVGILLLVLGVDVGTLLGEVTEPGVRVRVQETHADQKAPSFKYHACMYKVYNLHTCTCPMRTMIIMQ